MKKTILLIVGLVILILAGIFVYFKIYITTNTPSVVPISDRQPAIIYSDILKYDVDLLTIDLGRRKE